MNAHQIAAEFIADAEAAGVKARRTRDNESAQLWVNGADGMPVMTVTVNDHPAAGEPGIKIAARSLDLKDGLSGQAFTWGFKNGDLDNARTVWKELCESLVAARAIANKAPLTSVDIELDIEPPSQAMKVDTAGLASRALSALSPAPVSRHTPSSHFRP